MNDPIELLEKARAELTVLTARHRTTVTNFEACAAECDTLRTENARLLAALGERADIVQLVTERDAARTQLATANARITELTASQADFDRTLISELAELGINRKAVTTPKFNAKMDAQGRPLNADGTVNYTLMAQMAKQNQPNKPIP